MRKTLIPALLAALTFVPTAQAAGKLVCWTDNKGQRACGDRVPPEYAKGEREVLDGQGRVVEKKSKQKSAEQLAEEERQVAAAKAEKERFEKQSKYDRFLLQTFNSPKDLEQSRDSRLRALNGQIVLNDKSIAETEKTLKSLNTRVETAKKNGKPVDAGLTKQINQFEQGLAESRASIEQKRKEQDEVRAKFGADIERYNKLRSGELQIGAFDPAAAPAPSPTP